MTNKLATIEENWLELAGKFKDLILSLIDKLDVLEVGGNTAVFKFDLLALMLPLHDRVTKALKIRNASRVIF